MPAERPQFPPAPAAFDPAPSQTGILSREPDPTDPCVDFIPKMVAEIFRGTDRM
jgi:hypothetical protein